MLSLLNFSSYALVKSNGSLNVFLFPELPHFSFNKKGCRFLMHYAALKKELSLYLPEYI